MPHDIIDNRTRGPAPEINNPLADSIRAHRELNTLRRSKVTGQRSIEQLLRIVRDYNLENAYRTLSDRDEEAMLILRIVCSEALL